MFIAGMLAVPGVLNAQVEKRVEVSKAYVPSVEHATKLAVRPNMVDTAAIQPEIDYSITPLTLETQLATRPIRPATITYWEFDRPLPFYLKAGAGYPLNSALDLYVSTQNPDIGYALGYINHDGRYGRIPYTPDGDHSALWMDNRVGVAAGKYIGRHVLEGEVSYRNRIIDRSATISTTSRARISMSRSRRATGGIRWIRNSIWRIMSFRCWIIRTKTSGIWG